MTRRFKSNEPGIHLIVVGANPSGARSFTGKTTQEVDYPETDTTASRIYKWRERLVPKDPLSISRISIVNLSPIIETDSNKAASFISSYDSKKQGFQSQIDIVQLLMEDSVEKHKKCILLCAWGNPKGWTTDAFVEFLTKIKDKEKWQIDRGVDLNYCPHVLNRNKGTKFSGVKEYEYEEKIVSLWVNEINR